MFREIRGQTVHTASFGSGEQTVMGLSGSIGNWEIWQQPFELLCQRCRSIAYDHYGAGETRVPPELVTFEHQVQLVADLMDSFSVARCVLAGDSSMAAVAIEVAHRWPERVSALVLVSAGAHFAPGPGATRFVAGLRTNFDATIDAFVQVCLPEDDHGHLQAWLRDIIVRTGEERVVRLLESFHEVDVREILPAIRVPTLVIHGARDTIETSSRAAAEEIAGAIPGAELQVLPDAGHVPTLSQPAEVARAIEAFLGDV